MLQKLKNALQITTNDFNDELNDLISAAVLDLNLAGADNSTTVSETTTNKLVVRAIISYCAYHFEQVHGELGRAQALKIA